MTTRGPNLLEGKMGITRRDSAKKGNPRRNRRRERVSKAERGNRIPPLPHGYKKSQCYWDARYGCWVLKSHHPAAQATDGGKIVSAGELVDTLFGELSDEPAA